MNPIISNISEVDGFLNFTMSGCDVSVANGIRRIILSEIPTIVFRTTPHDKNDANIEVNTSTMNNEIIKQRLSCIPIHITDSDFVLENYLLEVDVKNDTDTIIYVTTADFKIKDVKTNTYLTAAANKKIFPPNSITADYIEFVSLRPRISDEISGEQLKMTCKFSIGISKEDSAFNVAATCSYGATQDIQKADKLWLIKESEMKKNNSSAEDVEFAKKDWELLEAKRNILPDSFDFIIESVGPFSNMYLVFKAADVMLNKLSKFQNTMQTQQDLISFSDCTINDCFDITIPFEGYTLGKVIEYILYTKHFGKTFSYCGFRKPHPHIDLSKLRIGFNNPTEKSNVVNYLVDAAEIAKQAFAKIAAEFSNV
jgi:DNA-directed RNA polymerase alpha subunit/DNA-directed RNA polymerase subunit L